MIADHLWQSTVFAGAIWLLTLALRNNRARVRHGLWLAASCKFLIPLALLIALGSHIQLRKAPQSAAALPVVLEEVSEPFTAPAVSSAFAAVAPLATSPLPKILFGIWACGFIGIAGAWWVPWRRIRAAVRAGSPLHLGLPIEARSSPTLMEPGIFGVFRPVLLLPEGIADRLTPAQLKAVIAHELCHVRHRDNLIAVIHMFVETVFWFHPLVWWIGKRMVEERERACDEEVLRDLGEPKAYAEGILNVCKLYVESPLECVSGVTGGSNLKHRIEAIMSNRIALKLNFGKKLLLAAAAVLAASGPLIVGLAKAQSQAPLAFEVASVKPREYPPEIVGTGDAGSIRISGNRVTILGTLTGFLMSAYNLKEFQISGAPRWTDKQGRLQQYDINAKAEGEGTLAMDQARRMLQALLADRFQLNLHHESRELPVYDLVVGKNGPKIKKHVGETPPIEPPQFSGALVKFKFVDRSMADLVGVIPRLDRPVLDKTGLMGSYDFTLQYSINKNDPDADLPVSTAIQEQLGLKLVEAKEPMDILVIDHAEKPSEN